MAPSPIIIQGAGLLTAQMFITHAMQISGGNFPVVPAMGGHIFYVVQWAIQKPSGWAAGYAPTNTTFNLRLGSLATNVAGGITPVVTNTTVRIDQALGVNLANLGAGLYSALVNQPLNVNCGAGNGGGNPANGSMLVIVQYIRIRALQLTP